MEFSDLSAARSFLPEQPRQPLSHSDKRSREELGPALYMITGILAANNSEYCPLFSLKILSKNKMVHLSTVSLKSTKNNTGTEPSDNAC